MSSVCGCYCDCVTNVHMEQSTRGCIGGIMCICEWMSSCGMGCDSVLCPSGLCRVARPWLPESMWLWRQSCTWGSVCHSVWSRCWRGWERPCLPLRCFFQASVLRSFATKAWGCILAWSPSNAVPPLLALAPCPVIASRVQPTFHLQTS